MSARVTVRLFVAAMALAAAQAAFGQEVHFGGMARSTLNAFIDQDLPLERTEQTLDLTLQGWLNNAALYANPVVYQDGMETPRLDLRETYLEFALPKADVRVGKQAVVWGQAEGVFITDVVSPRDLTNFILPDFREIRIGVPAVRATAYGSTFTYDVVWLPRFVPTTVPGTDSPWYVAPDMTEVAGRIASVGGAIPTVDTSRMATPELPADHLVNSEVFGKLSYFGSGLNAELMAAYAYDDEPAIALDRTVDEGALTVRPVPVHRRLSIVGGSASTTVASVVLRGEAAVYLDRTFTTTDPAASRGLVEHHHAHYAVGATWSLAGVSMGAQFVQSVIFDYDSALVREQYQNTITVRARDSFLADRLGVELFAYVGLDPYDALLRPKLTYAVDDGVDIEVGTDIFVGDAAGQFGRYDGTVLARAAVRYHF